MIKQKHSVTLFNQTSFQYDVYIRTTTFTSFNILMGNTKILLNKIFLKIKDTLVNRGAIFPMYIHRCRLAIKSLGLEIDNAFPNISIEFYVTLVNI